MVGIVGVEVPLEGTSLKEQEGNRRTFVVSQEEMARRSRDKSTVVSVETMSTKLKETSSSSSDGGKGDKEVRKRVRKKRGGGKMNEEIVARHQRKKRNNGGGRGNKGDEVVMNDGANGDARVETRSEEGEMVRKYGL